LPGGKKSNLTKRMIKLFWQINFSGIHLA